MRPQKRVRMCINEPDITKVMTRCLQSEFANKYDLSITETPYVGKLLAQAQSEGVDLFILLLNNMRLSDVPFSYFGDKNWVESVLAVITQLRQAYQKPVIAMTGYPGWTEDKTKEAGASFLFLLPVERAPLIYAVNQCLEEGALA